MKALSFFKGLSSSTERAVLSGKIATILVALAVIPLAPLPSMAKSKVVAIAVEGDTAPGTGGATFELGPCDDDGGEIFDEPMVNARGDVAFHACFEGGDGDGFGVFLKRNGQPLELIAKTGDTVPGVGDLSTFPDDFDGPKINDRGTVLFVVRNITDGSTTAAVFQKKIGQPLTAILKEGDPSPAGGFFEDFDDMDQNNQDDVAIIATYGATEGEYVGFNTGVFLINRNGTVDSIVTNGDTLPGTGGSVFNGTELFHIDGPWVNDNKVVAFVPDSASGGNICFEEDEGFEECAVGSVFAKQPGKPIEPFVLRGDPLPASFGGGTVQHIALGRPALNNSNVLGFNLDRASGTPETFLVTKKLGGAIQKCVADLTKAPGTTGTFNGFSAPTINNWGRLQFTADISGDATNDRGIYVCNGAGKVKPVVLRGDPKPGGGSWSFELEEGSISDNFVVFLDEARDENFDPLGTPGVFRATIP